MRWLLAIAAVTLVAGAGGCSDLPTMSAKQLSQLEAKQQARVLGRNAGALSFLELGTDFDITILSLDGSDAAYKLFMVQDLDLAAGHHQFVVDCAYATTTETSSSVDTKVTIEADLQAGHVYRLDPTPGDQRYTCKAALVDITDKVRLVNKSD